MTEEPRTLVRYQLSHAKEALEEAGLLLESDHPNTFVNRLYYACFYAVPALWPDMALQLPGGMP